jgi:acyl-CoA thioester hydrolase
VQGYRFKHRLKVRFFEVDSAQILFHSHYLEYLDEAVDDYYRNGLKYDRVELAKRGLFGYVIKKANLEFISPATINDWLNVYCKTVKIGNTSFVMRFLVTRDGDEKELLKAENLYVCFNFLQNATQPFPGFLRQAIAIYEGWNQNKHTPA